MVGRIAGSGGSAVPRLGPYAPGISEADGDELTRVAWQRLVAWVRDVRGTQAAGDVLVHSACVTGDEAAFRRLLEAGFVHERTFWDMAGRVRDEAKAASDGAGLTLSRTEDHATVHRLLMEGFMEGFAEHWAFEPASFEDWRTLERSMAGHDPGLWVLAEIDSVPVATMLMSRRSAAERAMYVQELTTSSADTHIPGRSPVSGVHGCSAHLPRGQVLQSYVAAGDQPVTGVASLHQPQLLGSPAVHRCRRRGQLVTGTGRAQEVSVVVDADTGAVIAEPHGSGDARRTLVDQAVHAAVGQAVRLQVLLGDRPGDHHPVRSHLGHGQAEDVVQQQGRGHQIVSHADILVR